MQHPSPYLAMSNNPVSFMDPTGLWDDDEIDIDFNFNNNNDSYKPKPKIKNVKIKDPKNEFKIEKKRYTFGIYSGETFLNTFELPENSSGNQVYDVHGKKRNVGAAYGEKAGKYITSTKNWALGLKAKKGDNDPYMKSHEEPVYTMNEFIQANKGLTRNEIINQRQDRSKTFLGSQAGGPKMRYVKNPHDGRVLDMRHMLVIGNYPAAVGNFLEGFQWITGQASGMDLQDFYSNAVGYQFYMQSSSVQLLINPSAFTDQLNSFFNNPRVIYNR